MTDEDADPAPAAESEGDVEDLRREVAELRHTLEDLQRELEPGDRRRLRPPSFDELRRFTAEVSIPALVLVLETNVRALRLLQRTLRMAEDEAERGGTGAAIGEGAAQAGRRTLAGLEGALADLQDALAGSADDAAARELLAEAQDLQASLDDRLATEPDRPADGVEIDVEAELESLKNQLDDDDDGPAGVVGDGG